ncbi:MAG TPA: DUF2934 domain-containing protein [Stellaceae bacterium]|nr:DUF2934 domain-containing protein [Stellaceae bacterium]
MAERDDEIRALAYAIWEQEGCPEGRSLDHWLRAEAEIAVDPPVVTPDDGKRPAAPELPKAA